MPNKKGDYSATKGKVLLDFFQKIVGFQRATPLVVLRKERNSKCLKEDLG